MSTGKLRQREKRHDAFYKKAKQENFAARAVYKLQEIDQKYHLFQSGNRVLDLGCWPGSWLQYAARVVGTHGVLVGVDRFPIEIDLSPLSVRMISGDVFSIPMEEMKGQLLGFDVVLSDLAPDTSGIRSSDQARSEALFERAFQIACALLVKNGRFVGKLFQGPDWNRLLLQCRKEFTQVKMMKPEGTRKESIEQYVVALGKK